MLYLPQARMRCIALVLFLGAMISTAVNAAEIQKGQVDNRIYHYFELKNQLKVILISDKDADKAAASLDVHVGSSDDPRDREGLAHFLEHMLFLGTEKYPNAADYQAFIDENAGSHNAYTSSEHTNYFFDIDADKLEPALDRFSQFFVAPLFDEVYVDRERNAVHSEYQARIKSDGRREYDVFRQLINPQHPFSKFSVGSLQTLADRPNDKVRDDLLDFYAKHYSSDQMTLVVLGKETIDELKRMVEARFDKVAFREVEAPVNKAPLFAGDALPMEVLIKPVQDIQQMEMLFPLPSIKAYYHQKPLNYLGSILGHEGKGSLLSVLKAQGWAEGLSAGGGEMGTGNATFSINISLTDEGLKQREMIRALVFHALDVIRQQGVEQWRYEEEKQLASLAFQFREKGRAVDTVSRLSSQLHDYPAEEVISAAYLFKSFDPKLIQRLLAEMTPQNLFVGTTYQEVKTDKVTHYYQVPYAVKPLSTSLVDVPEKLKQQYHLPQKNIFVPDSYGLKQAGKAFADIQKVDIKNPKIELWAKQDVSFLVPKAEVNLRVKSPLVATSVRHASMNDLLVAMINDNLNENSYPALLAGLSFSLSANSRGLDIRLAGYDNKMTTLLEMISERVSQPLLSEQRFTNIKKELMRHFNNTEQLSPYRRLFKAIPVTLYNPYFSDEAKAAELENISLSDLQAFSKQWLKGADLQGLFYGNINKKQVQEWRGLLPKLIQAGQQNIAAAKVVNLSNQSAPSTRAEDNAVLERRLVLDHNDNAAALYVQGLGDSLKDEAHMRLIRQILESSYYSQLRTEQQLGYIVFLTNVSFKDVPGSLFMVQSPNTSIEKIKAATEQFILQSVESIPDDLTPYQRSVATKLLEKSQSLSEEAGLHWKHIVEYDPSFSYQQRLVDAVYGISVKDLKAYYQQALLNKNTWLWFSAAKEGDALQPEFANKQGYYIYP